jgi:hypothetical protein
MVLRRVMRSPVKAAAGTAMSTVFSFAPARRRSREAQGALEPAADGVDVARGRAQRWWLKPFRAGRKVWSGQAAKNSNERNWSAVPQKADRL